MLDDKDICFLNKVFSDYNYIMTNAQLNAEKLFYKDIQRMIEAGLIEKVKRDYYHWVDSYGNLEVILINRLFLNAVFCMETALFYYRYSDRNPAE